MKSDAANMHTADFLPMSRQDMEARGWDELDILLVSGDAYVDHPSFGAVMIGRWLESHGYRVGIAAQPNRDRPEDLLAMGRPRLFAGITAGSIDSMLAHYTAFRKKRSDDAYTPGGKAGARPNRACIAYTGLVRHVFPGLPVILGGIEASLRRTSQYDFWSDSLRRTILFDSKADLVVYGMGELAILEVAERIKRYADQGSGPDYKEARELLAGIPGTAYAGTPPEGEESEALPDHEEIVANPELIMDATLRMEQQVHNGGPWLTQNTGGRTVVLAPPMRPVTTEELDRIHGLTFTRLPHPSYKQPIPATEMIRFSITTHRGCAGGCSFCSLSLHQGRRISSRSRESILAEARELTRHPSWNGSITDAGGPSANMWNAVCTKKDGICLRASCLTPDICGHFKSDQSGTADLLRELSGTDGVKHVRVSSGVRHDLALADAAYAEALISEFTGGQLKLAPEHMSDVVLGLMRKPGFGRFTDFLKMFSDISRSCGKEQYVVPYLISAFPGCTMKDMTELGNWLRERRWRPQQIQCFIPTPGTVATAMFWCGKSPDGKSIHVAKTDAERMRQHGVLQSLTENGGQRKHTAARRKGGPKGRSRRSK